jgi:hypothetical protein
VAAAAATAASALQPLPRCCRAASVALPPLLLLSPLPLCRRRHLPAIASVPPLLHLCSAALLLCHRCHRCTATNTALPPLPPSCHPATLPPCCLLPLRCRRRCHCRRCSAAIAALLPCCLRCSVSTAAAVLPPCHLAALPLFPSLCRRRSAASAT